MVIAHTYFFEIYAIQRIESCFEENKNIQATFDTVDILAVIQIYFDIIGKNLAKNFKTFEEYILFYNKVNIY